MNSGESIALFAGTLGLVLSVLCSIWSLVMVRRKSTATVSGTFQSTPEPVSGVLVYLNWGLMLLGLVAITLSLTLRAVSTGHGPFSSMYEFAVAFSWGILVMSLYFRWRYRIELIGLAGVIIALGLLIFARTLSSQAAPLVPALQQSLLLTTHVASAVISYGAFTIGFGAAILFLVKGKSDAESELLDRISCHSVMIGFPFMTLVIVLGALWADIAWGHYWSWDPKETASLVTWLLYAAYLHARVMRGWQGRRAAILLIIGFAAVLATFFGNYIFSGLHSYR
jgi:ABC-type transport system involved in cytochrome c biogenesis permease subunit